MSDRIRVAYGTHRPRKNSAAGLGAQYLHRARENGERIENAVALATGALYAPVEVALQGGTLQQVNEQITRSELAFSQYKALARQMAEGSVMHSETPTSKMSNSEMPTSETPNTEMSNSETPDSEMSASETPTPEHKVIEIGGTF